MEANGVDKLLDVLNDMYKTDIEKYGLMELSSEFEKVKCMKI